ncbi:MAG: hypothetical protein H6622_18230 [Halobacteriovoraceae bacterium]|nr:hypothetical protein [Halobacteriovoraceae bacterium]
MGQSQSKDISTAFNMLCTSKKIEAYNNDLIDLDESELEELSKKRVDLLDGYYKQEYGDNIITLH